MLAKVADIFITMPKVATFEGSLTSKAFVSDFLVSDFKILLAISSSNFGLDFSNVSN
jgi:hypothetical protein